MPFITIISREPFAVTERPSGGGVGCRRGLSGETVAKSRNVAMAAARFIAVPFGVDCVRCTPRPAKCNDAHRRPHSPAGSNRFGSEKGDCRGLDSRASISYNLCE